jgi:hypothetical protein
MNLKKELVGFGETLVNGWALAKASVIHFFFCEI